MRSGFVHAASASTFPKPSISSPIDEQFGNILIDDSYLFGFFKLFFKCFLSGSFGSVNQWDHRVLIIILLLLLFRRSWYFLVLRVL